MRWFDEILLAARPSKPGWGLRLIALLFGTVFGAGGCLVAYGMVIQPMSKIIASQTWSEVPAQVTSSELKRRSDSDGDTVYSIDIRYDYTWSGQLHHGTRYNFSEGSTNVAVGSMRRIVADHPEGKSVTAWVDPANPENAVLSRQIPRNLAMGLFFPLPFLAVGVCGLSYAFLAGSWFRRSQRLASQFQGMGAAYDLRMLESTLTEPPPTRSTTASAPHPRPLHFLPGRRWLDAGGLLFITLFWNGIVGVFISVVVLECLSGNTPWFLILFLIPFEIIGAIILIMLVCQCRTPRPPSILLASRVEDETSSPRRATLEWLDVGRDPALQLAFRPRPPVTDLLQARKQKRSFDSLPEDALAAPNTHHGRLEIELPPAAVKASRFAHTPNGVALDVFWTHDGAHWNRLAVSQIDAVSSS